MIKLDINNQRSIEMEYKNNWTVVTTKDSKGKIGRASCRERV